MDTRSSRERRFSRRQFVSALAAAPLIGSSLAHGGAAQTPIAEIGSGWQTWVAGASSAPSGSLRWRAIRDHAPILSEATFAPRPLGFVWNDYGESTLVVENESQGTTHELNALTGARAASFNDEQDSVSRGFRDETNDERDWSYPYFNFDLVPADAYDDRDALGEGELRGWSEPFEVSASETHLAFGSISIAQREAAVYMPNEGTGDQLPLFAMCLEGRFSPIHEGWQEGGLDIEPGDFVELSMSSPITHLYGRDRSNILVGVLSPAAGGIEVVNLAS